jgi:hypothetical protein
MQERPPAELVAIGHPEVDIAALAGEVRATAARLRGTAALSARSADTPRRHPLLDTADVTPPATSLGTLRRAVRRGLRWYLLPVIGRASAHNRAAADVIEKHRRALVRMRLETEQLDHQVALLDRRE